QGGYNCLHQDLYGELAFPLQVTCVLSSRDEDFSGGEFLLVEQRPRAQSRGEAISLDLGDAIIFPNARRPVAGTRSSYRVNVRHGVSTLRSGIRYSLGLIFHDAK
ncbi:MAG TPA: 2OG-Fe(II) oxygenase, partial [Candidatus Binataceae bacterium]